MWDFQKNSGVTGGQVLSRLTSISNSQRVFLMSHVATAPDLAVILLLSEDADRTAAFYREILSVPVLAERHDGRHTHYACRLGSVYFTIQPRTDLGEPPATGYDSLQLCFTVPSMEDFERGLSDRGIRALHPPTRFESTVFMTLKDPDGRHVRVMTPWTREESESDPSATQS